MKRATLVILSMLLSGSALAQTYSNANLNGKYSTQFGLVETNTWSKTFACPANLTITFTASNSGNSWTGVYGTFTFDGKGNFSFSGTGIGRPDQTASANTMSVTWNSSCQIVSVNGGSIVYLAPTAKTGTGTYSVKPNGTGSLTAASIKPPITFILAATNSVGISATALLTNAQTNGKSIGSGIAVRQ